ASTAGSGTDDVAPCSPTMMISAPRKRARRSARRRPLTSASAPPRAVLRAFSVATRPSGTTTESGVGAMSSSVPSTSRNSPVSAVNGGGIPGLARRRIFGLLARIEREHGGRRPRHRDELVVQLDRGGRTARHAVHRVGAEQQQHGADEQEQSARAKRGGERR